MKRAFCILFYIVLLSVNTLSLQGCAYIKKPPPEVRTEAGDFTKKTDSNKKVIVFIHGVLGNKDSTWRNSVTGAYWPTLVGGDPEMADTDVYVAGYYSPLLGSASNLEELSNRMFDQFERKGIFNYDQVYIIAHSMGGLIAKRILIKLNTPLKVEKLRHVAALLTFSTPSLGATIAELGSWISSNPQFQDMRPVDVNTFLQAVEADWNTLLIERDHTNVFTPRAYSAYETQPFARFTVIVNNFYAATRSDENPYAIDLDHSEIVKPASREADQYSWTKAHIRSIPQVGKTPLPDGTLITKSNIVEILGELGFTDVHVATEMHWIVDALAYNNITTKSKLRQVTEDRFVIAKLKQIYIEELKRPSNFPLDAVAVTLYGSYLWKNSTSDQAVEEIRRTVRTSQEYKQINVPNNSLITEAAQFDIPAKAAIFYVILQQPNREKVNGSSERIALVSRDEFLANFKVYAQEAKRKGMKLIITVATVGEQEWVQSEIKYNGNYLIPSEYRDPGSSHTYVGASIPLK